MLPGLKALLATVILAVAILTFALGAAALLRATHESFASLPTWKSPTEALSGFSGRQDIPTLAALRVEPEPPPSVATAAPLIAEPVPAPAVPVVTTVPPVEEKTEAAPQPQVMAALPPAAEPPTPEVAIAPREGPPLMPEIASVEGLPVGYANLGPIAAASEAELLAVAPLPRPRPDVAAAIAAAKAAAARAAQRRIAARSRPAPAATPFQQIFGSNN